MVWGRAPQLVLSVLRGVRAMAMRGLAVCAAILSIGVSIAVAEDGPRSDNDITGSLGPTSEIDRSPKITDFNRPIFTRDVAPVCNERGQLGPFTRWLETYKTYDPAMSEAMFGCKMAQDGVAVSLLDTPAPKVSSKPDLKTDIKAGPKSDAAAAEASGQRKLVATAKIGWERADGRLNSGYTWASALRN